MAKRNAPKDDAQIDVFTPLFSDIASRDAHETMEMPFFSLSKNPRFKAIRYQNDARGIEIIVTGGEPVGIATIWDKDILIWAVSQIREALDRGETPNPTIYFHPYQLLKAVRRGVDGGKDYKRLERGDGAAREHDDLYHHPRAPSHHEAWLSLDRRVSDRRRTTQRAKLPGCGRLRWQTGCIRPRPDRRSS